MARAARLKAGAIAALAAVPALAQAHGVETGLGAVADGVVHFAVSLEDGLAVLAFAIVSGLNGREAARFGPAAMAAAWVVAGAASTLAGTAPLPAALASASAVVLGAMGAAALRLGPLGCALLGAAVGAFHGIVNGGAGGSALAAVGMAAAAFAFAMAATTVVTRLVTPVPRIAARVAASWIGAIGLLVVGWALRYG